MKQTKTSSILILIALILFVALFVFFTYTFFHQIDLSSRAYSTETLTMFSVDKPAYAGVFIAIRSINTTYFDLRIIGPNGYVSTVLHGEGYSAFQDGGLWEENLAPGEYQIVLTSHQSPGTASV